MHGTAINSERKMSNASNLNGQVKTEPSLLHSHLCHRSSNTDAVQDVLYHDSSRILSAGSERFPSGSARNQSSGTALRSLHSPRQSVHWEDDDDNRVFIDDSVRNGIVHCSEPHRNRVDYENQVPTKRGSIVLPTNRERKDVGDKHGVWDGGVRQRGVEAGGRRQ